MATKNIAGLVLIFVVTFTSAQEEEINDFWCKYTSDQKGFCAVGSDCPSGSSPSIYARHLIGCFGSYAATCCVPDNISTTSPPTIVNTECGAQTKIAKILGPGSDTVIKCSWPWLVSIRGRIQPSRFPPSLASTDQFCSGVLIENSWVITTAYCAILAGATADSNVRNNLLVVAGEHDYTTIDGDEQLKTVSNYIIHHNSRLSSIRNAIDLITFPNTDLLKGNNFALLKLSSPVTFTECVKKACLGKDLNVDTSCGGDECYIAGWGISNTQVVSDIPKEAVVTLFPEEACAAIARYSGDVYNPQPATMCASAIVNGTTTCAGDSGGMVVCNQLGRWALRGLVNKPEIDCEDTKPFDVADLGAVQDWIETTMTNY